MDLKSAVQTVRPTETNVKWWKGNVRAKMFSLSILENVVKESGPIFRKNAIFSRKLAQIKHSNLISITVNADLANSPVLSLKIRSRVPDKLSDPLVTSHIGKIFSVYFQLCSIKIFDSFKFRRSCNINY